MNKVNRKNLIIATLVLVFAITSVMLFVLKNGVGDNGVQYQSLEKLGLYNVQYDSADSYYNDSFGVADKKFSGTSYGIPYDIAKQFAPIDGVISNIVPACLYILLFLVATAFLVYCLYFEKYKLLSVIITAIFVFMFCDSTYIGYLNTPYKNAAFYVYIIMMIAFFVFCVKKRTWWSLLLYTIGGCLFANTSTIAAVSSILLGIYSITLSGLKKEYVWKILSLAVSICIVAVGVFSLKADVNDMYNSVFYGATLEDESAVEKLGLDKELEEYIGVSFGEEKAQSFVNTPEYKDEFTSKISLKSMIKYYTKNISVLWNSLSDVNTDLSTMKNSMIQKYEEETGKQVLGEGFFSLYSSIKKNLVPLNGAGNLLIMLALILVCIIYILRYAKCKYQKIISGFCVVFAFSTLIIFPIPFILNGMYNITFNMFYFSVMCDICVFMLILNCINIIKEKRKILEEKYGVNQ